MIETRKEWKLDKLEYDNLYIVTDFDRTITLGSSIGSWGILERESYSSKKFVKETKDLFNYYRPLELDHSIEYNEKSKLMVEWWSKCISLYIKHKLSEDMVNEAIKDPNVMNLRDGAKAFLTKMHEHNVPVIIISAGVGNFIEKFLINNGCYYDNIYMVSNVIEFENGVAKGLKGDIIHTLNKNEVLLHNDIITKIKNRNQIILLGDSLDDVKMVPIDKRDQTIRIGFLEANIEKNRDLYLKEFDLICTNNTSFYEIMGKLNI